MSITGHDPPRPRTLEEAQQWTWVMPDGLRVPVSEKVAALVTFVVAIAGEIDGAEYFTLTFEGSQGDIKPRMERRWPAIKGKGKTDG